jgi:hypothetical protein
LRIESDLNNVMIDVESLEWNLYVYIDSSTAISMASLIMIINDDEESERDENDEPMYPRSKGYNSFLSVADLQDVKSNLAEQKPNFIINELIEAVKYYYENDAFVQVNS